MTIRRLLSRASGFSNQTAVLPGKTSGITGTAISDGLCFEPQVVSKGARAVSPPTAMEKIMNAPVDRRTLLATTVAVSSVGTAGTALAASPGTLTPEDVDQRIGTLAEEISELLPHHPIQNLGSRGWYVGVSERGYWFSAARASKQPAASLVASIQADREAVAAVEAARERLFELYAEHPDLYDPPHVLLDWGCIGMPQNVFTYEYIRAHVRRTGNFSLPKIDPTELAEREAGLIRELRRKRRAWFAEQRRVGITAAQKAVTAGWDRVERTRTAVLAHPCASMTDVVAKSRHLIEVVDRGDCDAMIEAWESILPIASRGAALS